MRAVVQRITEADVMVDGSITGKAGKGFMVLIGVEDGDGDKDIEYLSDKITGLRVFDDAEGKMNLSIKDIGGEILAVSQFTLLGDVRHGRRPSFIKASPPDMANELYRKLICSLQSKGIHVEEGIFQAEMLVRIYNDGPVTILLDSRRLF